MTLADGSVDASYYTENMGMHPDFVSGLTAIMAGVSLRQQLFCHVWNGCKNT